MTISSTVRFPGESDSYRAARDELLQTEAALRRHTEEVAAQRRELPLGGPVPKDYVFEEGGPPSSSAESFPPVRMSELFRPAKDTLVIYSFMYGPQMEHACPSCTSILDGLNGSSPHIQQRVNFVVVAKSPPARIRDFARERAWRNLRLLSSAQNSYNTDY